MVRCLAKPEIVLVRAPYPELLRQRLIPHLLVACGVVLLFERKRLVVNHPLAACETAHTPPLRSGRHKYILEGLPARHLTDFLDTQGEDKVNLDCSYAVCALDPVMNGEVCRAVDQHDPLSELWGGHWAAPRRIYR